MYLFLNDVAGSEVLLILFFVLIFFGSKSIPGIARTVGRAMRQIQDAKNEIQSELKKSTGDFKKDLNLDGIFREAADDIQRPLDQMADDLEYSVRYTPPKKQVPTPVDQQVESTEIPTNETPTQIGKETITETKTPLKEPIQTTNTSENNT